MEAVGRGAGRSWERSEVELGEERGGVGGEFRSLSMCFSPQANKDRVAAVLSVSGGQIGVFEASVHEYTNLCVTV